MSTRAPGMGQPSRVVGNQIPTHEPKNANQPARSLNPNLTPQKLNQTQTTFTKTVNANPNGTVTTTTTTTTTQPASNRDNLARTPATVGYIEPGTITFASNFQTPYAAIKAGEPNPLADRVIGPRNAIQVPRSQINQAGPAREEVGDRAIGSHVQTSVPTGGQRVENVVFVPNAQNTRGGPARQGEPACRDFRPAIIDASQRPDLSGRAANLGHGQPARGGPARDLNVRDPR